MSLFRRALLYLSLLGAGSLVALALAEAAVRWLVPQRLEYARAVFEPDDLLVFRLRPGIDSPNSQFEFEVRERTNSLGLRDRELGPKPDGDLRILALGDSYGFGHGVELEETYAKRLEDQLRGSLDRPVEVVNAGVPAWSLLQELRFLEHEGLGLQPDMVLLGFYVGNDLVDSYELFDASGRPTLGVEDGNLVSRKAGDEGGRLREATALLRHWLASRSHLYTLLRNRGSEILMRLGLRHVEVPCEFFRRGWTPKMEAEWSLTRKLLVELRDVTRRRGLPLVVVLIPTLYQVHDAQWQEYLKIFDLDGKDFDVEQPQRLLRAFCDEEGIDCVDVLPRLREGEAREPLYFRVDSHLNAAGHALVAQALAEHLLDSGIARLHRPPDRWAGGATPPGAAR
jgi:hypothetical protein